ncbi:glycosyltransferase [Colwellia sp. D2M02]|uniref:glycosyltransferase n=1 Tax=Colwellia sp. D2M02 TaxID=2841562 RepID=UPI001C0A4AFA|nr:glycosyltransferase [Colwellia sp. D2M02]MBU2892239.1 glycosyltransferase [Colwellia sp. D2M02]
MTKSTPQVETPIVTKPSKVMRILFCHNYYQQGGGEDVALENEMALLKKQGHDVQLYSVSNRQIVSFWQKLHVSFHLTYSRYYKTEFTKFIQDFKPDVIHVHNFFPLLTPAIFDACYEQNIPVVHTLHNYRLLCPSATLFIQGTNNQESITKSAYAVVKHRPYKNSFLGTFILARAIEKYKKSRIWFTKVNHFIAPSSCLKNIYVNAGFSAESITVKPHFIDPIETPITSSTRTDKYAVFIGRLTREKGIELLLESWRENDIELRVYGAGPLTYKVGAKKQKNIRYMGEVSKEQVLQALATSQYLIMPTLWQEPFGFVVIEAFSQGIPVIASNIGAMPELIKHHKNGLLFKANNRNELQNQIDVMKNIEKRDNMAQQAQLDFNQKYSAQVNYPQLLSIYQSVIARKPQRAN